MRQVPPERDINIAVNGCSRYANQKRPFKAFLHGLANFVPFNSQTLFPEYPWKLWHYGRTKIQNATGFISNSPAAAL